ncbi:MAG: 3-dehydroquinate synthase [Paludibacteraceae bacterium]|nr:3-dehydroquinate synthase [Paludibacteraceae bacterium]
MICTDLIKAIESIAARYEAQQIGIVSDAAVMLEAVTSRYPTLRIAVSEEEKSLDTVQRIWDFLFAHGITRRGVLICIGGGVLTDMGGFAAATYKRGIDYVNVPTTLLAMIDASSGGKTGINYGGLKNSIGCFAPPVETLICPDWLKSLPANQWLSGFGEMLKTGLVSESSLWYHLLRYDLEKMDSEALKPLIAQCVAAKKRIVEADPKEKGLRKVLNFGHTFGHALEEISIQKSDVSSPPLLHGYAVVYGMIAELYLSVVKLGCPKEPLQQLTQVMLHYYGKPQCKCSDREALVALMQQDKKNERTAQINCTLIQDIGLPLINQVITPEEAHEALEYLFSL